MRKSLLLLLALTACSSSHPRPVATSVLCNGLSNLSSHIATDLRTGADGDLPGSAAGLLGDSGTAISLSKKMSDPDMRSATVKLGQVLSRVSASLTASQSPDTQALSDAQANLVPFCASSG